MDNSFNSVCVISLFPHLDLKKISSGQTLTLCFGENPHRTRISFLIERSAGFNIEDTAMGLIAGCSLPKDIETAFSEANLFIPPTGEPCALFGSCVKDLNSFVGIREIKPHKVIKGKHFYWVTRPDTKDECGWIFLDLISLWLLH